MARLDKCSDELRRIHEFKVANDVVENDAEFLQHHFPSFLSPLPGAFRFRPRAW